MSSARRTVLLAGIFLLVCRRRLERGATALLAVAALASAASCTVTPAPSDLGALRSFFVEDPLPVLEATGAVSFTYKGDTESGDLFVRTAPGGATLIQLKARVTGSLALEIRFDARQLLVIDYVHKSYYQGDNTPETRNTLFSIDLSPEEFRMVLTGRVSRRDFEQGRGTLQGPHEAVYRRGADRYLFTLGPDGLPMSWVKQHEGLMQFRVEYRTYLDVPSDGGLPVRLPERARVYVTGSKPTLVLGLRDFTAPKHPPEPTFALPPEAAGFQPE